MGQFRFAAAFGAIAIALCASGCAVGVFDEPVSGSELLDQSEPNMVVSYDESYAGAASAIDAPVLQPDLAAVTPVQMLSEQQACERIFDAISERALFIGCGVTVHICPDLLRIEHGESCLLYDEAAVDACTDKILGEHMCGIVPKLPCEDLAIAASAPAGCAD